MRRDELRKLSRDELIARASSQGVRRPAVLTKAELIDELLKQTLALGGGTGRGWLGRARDLLAAVVERGLHLPDTARLLRGQSAPMPSGHPPPPLATVTLAEIYAAQGHTKKALKVLGEVLDRETDNREARVLYERLGGTPRTHSITPATSSPQDGAPATSSPQDGAPATSSPQDGAPATSSPQDGAPPATARPSHYATLEEGALSQPPVTEPEPSTQPVTTNRVARIAREQDSPGLFTAAPEPPPAAAPSAPKAAASELEATLESELQPMSGDVTTAIADGAGPAIDELDDADEAPGATDGGVEFIDDLVVLATDPRTAYVYWELRPLHYARARWADPTGALVLRVLTVTADKTDTYVAHKDLPVSQMAGDCFLRGLPPGAELRLCVGWLGDKGFAPLVVAPDMQMPREMLGLGGFARELPLSNALQGLRGDAVSAEDAPLLGEAVIRRTAMDNLHGDGGRAGMRGGVTRRLGGAGARHAAPRAPSGGGGLPRSAWPALAPDGARALDEQSVGPRGGSSAQFGG
ncbi:MAG TPA: DUF4912 domain-containing protein, partial [Sorangium sp.]|nr:DUF4912 domain-containing protein [Sorangium sp.]